MDKTGWLMALVLAALALLAVALWAWIYGPGLLPSTPPPAPVPSTISVLQSNPAPAANVTPDASARLQAQWALITKDNVQRACLSVAKAAAATQGYNPAVVMGCSCQAAESTSQKSYQCQISALDGQHPASIACTLSEQTCQISSQQGNATYTFDQLQAVAGS